MKSPYNIFITFLIFLVLAGFVILQPRIQEQFYAMYKPAAIPEYAVQYSVSRASCTGPNNDCGSIQLVFNASEKAASLIPPYKIKESVQEAKTEISFHRIDNVDSQFTYKDVMDSPFIDKLDYNQVNGDFIMTIYRKGNITPVSIKRSGSEAIILLSENKDNFNFSNEEPVPDSVVYPSKQNISLDINSKFPLEKTSMYIGDNLVKAVMVALGPNDYQLNYISPLEKDQQYKIKVIAVDSQNNVGVAVWEFAAQSPAKRGVLESDRFKYLGWWGQINANDVPIYSDPSTQSQKVGTFSTINRIKVLEEASGESIRRNNLWYKIDGGVHPGTYVFSGHVTSIAQPELPSSVVIPDGVRDGEYWIDVDLTKKVLTLFLYDKPVFATYVATGRPTNPTLAGTYRIWYKLSKTRMKGGPPTVPYRYDLPNVPYVMYYRGSYAVHGTYWHDKFGSQQSAGCTNLTQGDAKYIFDLINPKLPDGVNSIRSTTDNPGTIVRNHY